MKKIAFFISFISIVASCKPNFAEDCDQFSDVTFYAQIENGASKTMMDSIGKVSWLPGDSLSLFYGEYPYQKTCLVCTNHEPSSNGLFRGLIDKSIDSQEYFAIYPYQKNAQFVSERFVRINLPTRQKAVAGSFADDLIISVARSRGNYLYFENVCGGIGFTVTNERIKSISFEGLSLGGEVLVGLPQYSTPYVSYNGTTGNWSDYGLDPNDDREITLIAEDGECLEPGKWYYMVTYPSTFNGYTITITLDDGRKAKKHSDNQVSIKRSKFGLLSNVDAGLVFEDIDSQLIAEREALMELYNAGDGANWPDYIKRNWCSELPVNEWGGVNTDLYGRVSHIDIHGFKGALPESICNLKHLKQLRIGGHLLGSLPSFLSGLESLEVLSIGSDESPTSGEHLTGDINIDWSKLRNLKELYITGQYISGPIPASLMDLPNLRVLNLSYNRLSGYIPSSINQLQSLEVLNLSANHLEGTIPHELCNLSKLTYLNLSGNEITGSIPDNIGNLSSLEELRLQATVSIIGVQNEREYRNTLSGTIPSSIGNVKTLRILDLSENQFSGEIPGAIWGLPELVELRLSSNDFAGTIPSSIGNAKNLEFLDLNTNQLSGSLPEELWGLNKLRYINLGSDFTKSTKNHFTGGISSSISCLTELETIIAYNCDLSGEIPSSITSLQKLQTLQIHNNNLTGSIPEGIKDMVSLSTFWCQGNKLTGIISSTLLDIIQQKNTYTGIGWIIGPQQDGYGFEFAAYESSDYSKHKEVKVLQRATKGNGINMVLMGDAFLDKDIQDGTYDKAINLMYEALFEIEPYKSTKELFNVYQITLVSKNSYLGGESALGISSLYNKYFINSSSLIRSVVHDLIPGLEDDCLTISIADPIPLRSCAYYYYPSTNMLGANGLGIGIIKYQRNIETISFENDYKFTVQHEICGHAFGKLADEYVEELGTTITDDEINNVEQWHKEGWYLNIDTTPSSEKILWRDYLNLDHYVEEGVGIFEGAMKHSFGVWRASENSIMKSSSFNHFNAPSREVIYRRILQLAYGVTPSFEEFVSWDIQHKQPVNQAALRRAKAENTMLNPKDKPFSDCVIVVE